MKNPMTRTFGVLSTAILAIAATPHFARAQALESGIRVAQAEPSGEKKPPQPGQKPTPPNQQNQRPQQTQQQQQPGQKPPAGQPPQKPAGVTPPPPTPGQPAQKPAAVTPPAPGQPPQRPAAVTPPPPAPGQPAQRPAGITPPPGAPQRPVQPALTPAQPPHPGAPAAVANVPLDPHAGPHHLDQLRNERHETHEGNATVIQEADRTIIREGGHDIIRHNEADRFRVNAREVNVEHRGNDTITVALRPDGSRIVTEVDVNGRLLRRIRRDAQGREVIIIDNTFEPRGPGYAGFFVDLPVPTIRIPRELYIRELNRATVDDVYLTLMAPPVDRIERRYALDEIRYSEPLRLRMPRVDIDTVNFETGSWEIAPDQFDRLAFVAQGILRAVQRNPREVFMIEGYTDAVGNDVDNLSLSDRRAEAVAVVLTDHFNVPPENLTTQGYGKQFLKIPTDAAERANRRVAVRRITPLLIGQN